MALKQSCHRVRALNVLYEEEDTCWHDAHLFVHWMYCICECIVYVQYIHHGLTATNSSDTFMECILYIHKWMFCIHDEYVTKKKMKRHAFKWSDLDGVLAPPHMTCILLLIWHVSSSSYDMYPSYPPPHMTCILLLIWHVSSSSYDMYPPPHMTCILLLIWHVSSSSHDMYPSPHMTCILLLIWHVSSSSYDMYPPPHMTCILLLIWHVSSSSYDMYPPPHMTCILLLIWHVSSSSYDMYPPPHMPCRCRVSA